MTEVNLGEKVPICNKMIDYTKYKSFFEPAKISGEYSMLSGTTGYSSTLCSNHYSSTIASNHAGSSDNFYNKSTGDNINFAADFIL